MEPFPLDLQSSHLNICYYHQDARGGAPRARARVLRRPRALTHRGTALATAAGIGPRASAPSISGLRGFDNHRLPRLVSSASHLGQRERGAAGGQHPPHQPEGEVWSGGSVVWPRRACPQPSGRAQLAFKDFDGSAGLRNSHQVSHLATFFDHERYPLRVVLTSESALAPGRTIYGRGAMLDRSSSLARFARGFVVLAGKAAARASASEAESHAPPGVWPSPGCISGFRGSFCVRGFNNDPSAGSPHGNLIRLLLPLNDKVEWTSCGVAANPRRRNPNTSRTIQSVGRRRCVQRAGA
ncbi:hypothetical protein FNV43_RR21509 [Rhamnella rubrinervis]|uniref:Uncharacterized protein n=1 Tax=Rhamnella rubrinervis TaxID=2594499 RepID=A0A8K0GXR3_9ROSA|nr:hypothetical protein FNV43_RR21509 [Rhamnella rubrinervis]